MTERNDMQILVDDVLHGIDRRQLIKRAAALGVAVPGILALRAVEEGMRAQDTSSFPIPTRILRPKSADHSAQSWSTIRSRSTSW